jgi:membrane protease YdiL (CAAX protease family)
MEKDILKTPVLPSKNRSEARLARILTLLVYLAAMAVGEGIAVYSSRQDGMVIYGFTFAILLAHFYLERESLERKLLLALALVPLIRLSDLAIPLASFYDLYRYVIISIPVLIATVAVLRVMEFQPDDVGFLVRYLPLQIAVALTGIPLGLAGYFIFNPQRLVIGLTWGDMVLPGIIFVVCVGFVQELIFRGLLQHASGQILGGWGILYVSLLFAISNMGQLSVLNMIFLFGVAVYFSLVVKKTGSLLGVSLAHGIMRMGVSLMMPVVV